MKRGSKLTIWCLILCAGTAVAAQDSMPESKTEPTAANHPPRHKRGGSCEFL